MAICPPRPSYTTMHLKAMKLSSSSSYLSSLKIKYLSHSGRDEMKICWEQKRRITRYRSSSRLTHRRLSYRTVTGKLFAALGIVPKIEQANVSYCFALPNQPIQVRRREETTRALRNEIKSRASGDFACCDRLVGFVK